MQVQVLTCKFLNDQGYGYASDAVACIDYCLENGADIITNSWSGGEDNPALRDAIQHSLDKGTAAGIINEAIMLYMCFNFLQMKANVIALIAFRCFICGGGRQHRFKSGCR